MAREGQTLNRFQVYEDYAITTFAVGTEKNVIVHGDYHCSKTDTIEKTPE